MFELIVGNVGTVYTGADEVEAQRLFNHYAALASDGRGRCAYEDVYLMQDGEPVAECRFVTEE